MLWQTIAFLPLSPLASCIRSQGIDEQEIYNNLPHEAAQSLPLVFKSMGYIKGSVCLHAFVVLAKAFLLEMDPTLQRLRTTEEESPAISNPLSIAWSSDIGKGEKES
ncbi:hypothetical protein VNO77_03650 [Canavalia gladiata]|uniref:Uncharacterized protein n=1 Tax=Canavalia gladiata TaxID=3824 RepID=A0AAN9R444_CANGL